MGGGGSSLKPSSLIEVYAYDDVSSINATFVYNDGHNVIDLTVILLYTKILHHNTVNTA